MSVEFGSELLDVAFALAFIYFLLSLVVFAVTEAISWAVQQRARNLLDGMKTLLADEKGEDELTRKVLTHPLVKGMNKKRRVLPEVPLPSYVSPRNFALAVIETLQEPGSALDTAIEQLPDDLKRQLGPLRRAAGDGIEDFRKSIEGWYDDAMQRVSGWYKRWAQLVTILVALAVTVALNVDTIRVTDRLFNDDTVRAQVVSAGEAALREGDAAGAGEEEPSEAEGGGGEAASAGADPVESGEKAEAAVGELTSLKLPIGWDAANDRVNLATIVGWLLTAIAVSLGAPFWFDAMGKVARLRTTGGKPPERDEP